MSGTALDMTLEDLIKSNKNSAARGRGRTAGPGPARSQPNRSANRAGPYSVPKAPESAWGHDMFSDGGGTLPSAIETGTKLYISNLDYGVSTEDIKELLAEVGDMKRYMIHYDRIGRSKGTAEVVFSRRQDALTAIKRYNNVQLDGKPMKIELVGTNISTSAAGLPSSGVFGDSSVVPRRETCYRRNHGHFYQHGVPIPDTFCIRVQVREYCNQPVELAQGRGGGRGRGFVRGRGRGRASRGEQISADDLDADLDKYHADSIHINRV
ncbi:hypothetical protein OROGR_027749 [Orobanche gracilis]